MKKSAILLMLAGLWWACNSVPSPAGENPSGDDQQHSHAVGLMLNNGQKWKADMSTNENVASLCTIARDFAGEAHTGLTDYETLGSGLQQGVDKMIRECRMEGAGHDALHLWLEPLLVSMSELKRADNVASAAEISHTIQERLELYTQYFE